MSYCKKCGKELASSENFCSNCGTKVDGVTFQDAVSSVKRSTVQLSENVIKNVQSFDFGNKAKATFESLGQAKPFFFATVCAYLLNFLLSFSDMVELSLLFYSQSASFLGFFQLIKDYYGSGSDADYCIPIIVACNIMTIISVALTALPFLFGKKYNKKFLLLNYFSSILETLVYLFLIVVFKSSQYSSEVHIQFMAYVFVAETIAAFVCTVAFSSKLKSIERQTKNDLTATAVINSKEDVE